MVVDREVVDALQKLREVVQGWVDLADKKNGNIFIISAESHTTLSTAYIRKLLDNTKGGV